MRWICFPLDRPGYGGWLRDGYTGFRCVLELPKP